MSRWIALLPELALAATILAIFAALLTGPLGARRARNAARAGAWLFVVACVVALDARLELFGAAYRLDAASQLVKLGIGAGFAVSVFIAGDGAGQRADARGELFFFLATSTLGLVVMASAVEAVTLYLGLEIASFSLFVLVPLRERFDAGKEAGLKFLLVGLGASAVTLYGLSLLVGLAGTTNLADIGSSLPLAGHGAVAVFGLALLLAGFLFKLAVFPFHFWAPDAYTGASHGVAAFVATASKVAAVLVLARLIALGGFALLPLAGAFALIAAVSMTVGNLVALLQKDVKRMLGYSAVAQAGYIMVGFTAAHPDGLAAALFYALLYLLMNGAAFLVVARVARGGGNPSLDDLRGLHRRAPLLAATLLLALFALAGVPPTAGFAGKLLLFRAAVLQDWWWLVLLAAVNSTVSIYYYLIAIKHAYLLPAEGGAADAPLPLSLGDRVLCFALCVGLLLPGVWPAPLYDLSARAAASLLR